MVKGKKLTFSFFLTLHLFLYTSINEWSHNRKAYFPLGNFVSVPRRILPPYCPTAVVTEHAAPFESESNFRSKDQQNLEASAQVSQVLMETSYTLLNPFLNLGPHAAFLLLCFAWDRKPFFYEVPEMCVNLRKEIKAFLVYGVNHIPLYCCQSLASFLEGIQLHPTASYNFTSF